MSGNEMRAQKMRLRMEVEDIEENLKHLRLKASSQGELLIDLGAQLRETPELVYRDGMSALHDAPTQQLSFVSNQTVSALQLAAIIDTTNEIRKESLKLRRLQESLARLR